MFEKVIDKDISRDMFIEILTNYYANKHGNTVIIKESLDVKYDDLMPVPNIEFQLYEEIKHENSVSKMSTYLSQRDIEEALTDYSLSLGYEFDSYKYIGGVRKIGYMIEEDSAYFEGIKLFMKEKSIQRKLKR